MSKKVQDGPQKVGKPTMRAAVLLCVRRPAIRRRRARAREVDVNCYSLKYMVFPMGTGLLVAGAVLVYKSWTPQQATLVIAGICIVVSVTILGKIISSSGGYNGEEDAPAFSACLGQIVAAFVTVAAVLTEGTDHPLPANYMYFIVLAVALVAAGRQPLLSGGSLIVIILSSAFLYWLPIMLL